VLSRFSDASSFEPRVTMAASRSGPRRRATQFYAPTPYRQGWGQCLYYDQDLINRGLEAVTAQRPTANGSLTVDDPNLQMHTVAELKAELEQARSEAGRSQSVEGFAHTEIRR